jgi:hypothetical protein
LRGQHPYPISSSRLTILVVQIKKAFPADNDDSGCSGDSGDNGDSGDTDRQQW